MELRPEQQQSFFSERIKHVPRSFIRDILQVAVSPDVISFAGGLPNKKYFPVNELQESANRIFTKSPGEIFQYSNTEGFAPLREYISAYYLQKGLKVNPSNIMITTGSQQALDLIGKTLIDEGDSVILEEPAYLGAIQAFSMFQPRFHCVPLRDSGIDISLFEHNIVKTNSRLAYVVPNFQNPSGITYSKDTRKEIAQIALHNNLLVVEDDPYGEIRFSGNNIPSIYSFAPSNTILLGTFSKTVAPGLRVGWVVAPDMVMNKLIVAKQAADLHTDIFAQQLVCDYLINNPVKNHLETIRNAYGKQAYAMMGAIEKHFPADVNYTKPEGGMFLWVTLPERNSTMKLFEMAIKKKVAFVPGMPFLIGKSDSNCMRLNFSCSEPETIFEGIKRIAECLCE